MQNVMDKNGNDLNLWRILAPLRAMRYIIGNSYFPGDITLQTKRLDQAREYNVLVLQGGSASSPTNLGV